MNKTAIFAVLAVSTLMTSSAFAQAPQKVQVGNSQQEFPESVTSTSDGTLFAGSVAHGTIFRAAPGATNADVFIASPAEGPSAVLGVYADEANGSLWACYADMAAFGGGESLPSVLRSYDLTTGALKASASFDGISLCNDIATTADGTAYAADTYAARIVRVTPGSEAAEDWAADEILAGADGLSFGPDGHLYVNSVTTGKLVRINVGSDGTAGDITDLTLSEELLGPDGMRFGDDGLLYIAENANGRVVAGKIDGDNVTITPVPGDVYDFPASLTKVGDTLWVLESKLGKMGGAEDPGAFFIYPVTLQ